MMPNDTDARSRAVWVALRKACPDLGIRRISVFASGMEATVYRATTATGGDLAVKVPHARWLQSDNEPNLDTLALLEQEFCIATYLLPYGIPTPRAVALHHEELG